MQATAPSTSPGRPPSGESELRYEHRQASYPAVSCVLVALASLHNGSPCGASTTAGSQRSQFIRMRAPASLLYSWLAPAHTCHMYYMVGLWSAGFECFEEIERDSKTSRVQGGGGALTWPETRPHEQASRTDRARGKREGEPLASWMDLEQW